MRKLAEGMFREIFEQKQKVSEGFITFWNLLKDALKFHKLLQKPSVCFRAQKLSRVVVVCGEEGG